MVYSYYILLFSLAITVHIGGTGISKKRFYITDNHSFVFDNLSYKKYYPPILSFTNSSLFITPKTMDSNHPLRLIKFVIHHYNFGI